MYIKSRWKTWLFLILLALAIKVLPGHINTFLAQRAEKKQADAIIHTYILKVEDVSSAIKNKIFEEKINVNGTNIKFIDSFSEPDIIITRADETHDGYIELKNYLYIPYVMVSNPNLSGASQNCFGKVNKNKFKKDIRYLLSAIEEDKKWKDLGFNGESVVKGNVSFIIPDKYSMAYQDIRKYFILALNDFNMPNEDEIDNLSLRADNILAKCTKVESIQSKFGEDGWFKQIILCQESIIAERPSDFGNCIIINPGKTIKADYNVYIKKDKVEEVKTILKSYQFLELSGFRNIEYNNTLESDPYSKSFITFDYVDEKISENLERPATEVLAETKTETKEETTEVNKESLNETIEETIEEIIDETKEDNLGETLQEETDEPEEDLIFLFLKSVLIILAIILVIVLLGSLFYIYF